MMAAKPAKAKKVEQIIPSAARTIASLRDIGYDLPRAIADIVDNSIAAEATQVDITLRFDGTGSWIRIADNGHGMDAPTLLEAMRYGSERDYDPNDLGRFGFGLKTASTSQCRRLTVVSRKAEQYRRFEVRCLDLGHIEETNRWEVLVLEGKDRPDHALEPLHDHVGTVVLWEDLDRVLDYSDPWGGWAQRRMLSLAQEVDEHLAMVFHRFLAGQVRGRKLQMTVNGSVVHPWDPFCRDEPKTEELPAKDLRVSGEKGFGIVRVRPFVVPPQAEFSDSTAWNRASGPAKWNRQQGLYIYRANRLIQPGGGWNRLRTIDEHTKLARVAVDFFPDLDAAFGLNIAKAYVQLPPDLREELKPLVDTVARRADQRYRSGQNGGRSRGTGGSRSVGAGSASGRSLSQGSGGGRPDLGADGRSGSRAKTWVTPRKAIEDAASAADEVAALGRIVKALKSKHPEVAGELGW